MRKSIPGACRRGYRHRPDGGTAGETVPGIHPGGFAHRAPLRRDGARIARMMGGDVTVRASRARGHSAWQGLEIEKNIPQRGMVSAHADTLCTVGSPKL